MDYIVFNGDELLSIALTGFIGLCDNTYIIPECRNVTFAAIGNVNASICMTADECEKHGVKFLNFTPKYAPKYANVPLVRDGAAKAGGFAADSFSTSYSSSYASSYTASYAASFAASYITSYTTSFAASYITSFAASYMYEYEYEYRTSYRSSYSSSYSASYSASYLSSYASSYALNAPYKLAPKTKPRQNSREIIAVNGYGINLI